MYLPIVLAVSREEKGMPLIPKLQKMLQCLINGIGENLFIVIELFLLNFEIVFFILAFRVFTK